MGIGQNLGLSVGQSLGTSSAYIKPSSGWKYSPGHTYDNEAIVPFRLLNPLPDGGTGKAFVNSWARHRWAHSQFLYRYPVKAQGGAPPYRYEIIENATYNKPAGMSIGEKKGDANHGYLTWMPSGESQNDQWNIKILITDHEDNTQETTFALELDDDMFRVQDADWGGPYNGTWAEPYKLFSDWYGGTSTAMADTQGKIMVYKGGSAHVAIVATDLPSNTPQMSFSNGAQKPMCHIGVPGAGASWDFSNAQVLAANVGSSAPCHNICFIDIDVDGSPGTSTLNSKDFVVGPNSRQFLASRMSFTNQAIGSVHTNNEACFYFTTLANVRESIVFDKITTDSLPSSGFANGYGLANIYTSNYVLFEDCVDLSASTPAEFLFIKVSIKYLTIRGCTFRGINSGRGILYLYNSENFGIDSGFHEVCYNNIKCAVDDIGSPAIITTAAGFSAVGPISVFRNTFEGPVQHRFVAGNDPAYFLRNVVISTTPIDTDFTVPSGETNVYETSASGVVDSNGLLEDSYLTAEGMVRGTHGHELA